MGNYRKKHINPRLAFFILVVVLVTLICISIPVYDHVFSREQIFDRHMFFDRLMFYCAIGVLTGTLLATIFLFRMKVETMIRLIRAQFLFCTSGLATSCTGEAVCLSLILQFVLTSA